MNYADLFRAMLPETVLEVAALLVFGSSGVDRQRRFNLPRAQGLERHGEILESANVHALEILAGELLVEFMRLAFLEAAVLDADGFARANFSDGVSR